MKLRTLSRVIVLALVLLVGAIIVVRDHLAASHSAPSRAAPQGSYTPSRFPNVVGTGIRTWYVSTSSIADRSGAVVVT